MTANGIILYGPPAAGKDSITAALERRPGATFVLFAKLKAGAGRADGYRPATGEEIDRLRRRGDVVHENRRYGNHYVVDRPALDDLAHRAVIPVVHMGQLDGVRALRRHGPRRWLSVLVWCSRATTANRLRHRGAVDAPERLRVWDATAEDLAGQVTGDFHLVIDTDRLVPEAAAATIARHLTPAADGPTSSVLGPTGHVGGVCGAVT